MTPALSRGPTRTHRGHDVPYNPALPDKFQFLSSTQEKQFRECNRKWFFTTQRKIDVGSTAAMALGSDVHNILEEYGHTGIWLDAPEYWIKKISPVFRADATDDEKLTSIKYFQRVHEIATEALQYLPEWGNDWQPEVNLADPEQGPQLFLAGVPFVSYADLYVPARLNLYTGDYLNIELPLIVDYKTTSALHWAKTEAQLKQDIQGVAYARWALEKSYKIDWADAASLDQYRVRVKFPWLLTKGKSLPRSQCTDFVMSAADTVEPWAGFERDVLTMLDLAWKAQSDDLQDREVPGNYTACDAWGGCPHRSLCERITRDDLDNQLVQLRTSKESTVSKNLSDMLNNTVDKIFGTEITPFVQQPGFDLYVDAVPLRGVPQSVFLEDYLVPLNAQVTKEWNDAHGNSFLDMLQIDFGKWKGPLRALLVKNPPSGAVLVRSVGETSTVALEVLKPLARSVIQGVR